MEAPGPAVALLPLRPPSPARDSPFCCSVASVPAGRLAFPIGCGACQGRRGRRVRANRKQAGRCSAAECAAAGPRRRRGTRGRPGPVQPAGRGERDGPGGGGRTSRAPSRSVPSPRGAPAPRRCLRDGSAGSLLVTGGRRGPAR